MEKNKLNFITEIASTHNGNINIVKKIFKNHLKSNSDYIKFQLLNTNELYKVNSKLNKKFKKLEIEKLLIEKLILQYNKKTKIILEIFDEKSYDFAKKFSSNVFIKISCSEADNISLILNACQKFKKVFINFSGYEFNEIKKILKKINIYKKKIIILYGFQSYPSSSVDLRYELFDFFKENNFTFGYSDHTYFKNYNELIWATSVALAKGAKFVEKHVCINQKSRPPDYISALEFKEFNRYIKDSNQIFSNLLGNSFKLSIKELNYKYTMRKFLTYDKTIKKYKFLRTSYSKISRLMKKTY
jgi:sialic acid synthase SpsE